jgi:glycosyltransferase involved in cell wall biosynthesis
MSEKKNLISVVIPIYNRADWVEETLEHIFAQQEAVDEIILCDDGSTDDLYTVIEPYINKVKIIKIENSGPGVARKVAIENSSNEWIALCDSDDFWFPNHIKNFKIACSNFSEMNFYFANFRLSDDSLNSKFSNAPTNWFNFVARKSDSTEFLDCGKNLYKGLLDFQCCFQSACIFRKELYDLVGGIDSAISRWPSEDAHLTRRLAAYGNTVICKSETVLINKHESNFSKNHLLNYQGRQKILTKLVLDRSLPDINTVQTEEEIDRSRLHLFRLYFWNKEHRKAVNFFRQELRWQGSTKDYIRFFVSLFLSFSKLRR